MQRIATCYRKNACVSRIVHKAARRYSVTDRILLSPVQICYNVKCSPFDNVSMSRNNDHSNELVKQCNYKRKYCMIQMKDKGNNTINQCNYNEEYYVNYNDGG